MTTTTFLQQKPDYYLSKEECVMDVKVKIQTNLRYKGFNQRQFTVGDEEQFQRYRNPTNGQVCIPDINLSKNLFNSINISIWSGYKDLEAPDVINTFRYIFNKFKKGIFVKIKDRKLNVFLPFSKANFTNEWGENINIDPKQYRTINDFLKYISKMQGYNFNPNNVHQDTRKWYGNNCLLRYENPISEGDSNVSNVKNMLEELCNNRDIPDIEFFINRRDFPLLTKDGTEPYDGVWNSEQKKLVSHLYRKYVPILSMSKTDKYADVLNPTWDDWARVQKDIWFPNTCRDYEDNFDTPWERKKNIAVFRGGSTGCGTTIQTNMRLKIAEMGLKNKKYLDAGITNWNVRPRKNRGEKYLQTIHPDKLPFGLISRLSPKEQSKYKYIVHIQGHVSAFRLSLELNMGSVILYVKNPWKIWYTDMLKPYKHYVPIKEDLSDLISQIKWCINHDKECQEISKNALEFYNKYLQKDGILDYMQNIIVELKKTVGVYLYNTETPVQAMVNNIENLPKQIHIPTMAVTKTFGIHKIPSIGRSFGLLQGIEWMVDLTGNSFPTIAKDEGEIFKNKLGSIRKYTLAGFSFVVKSTIDPYKKLEHIHEHFIGINSINNLLKDIPNFVYIFGKYNDSNVVIEHIHGETLGDYISSSSFNVEDFMIILVQICLALEIAQKRCGFVHWDLKPWNIILQKFSKPKTFDYALSYDTVYRVKTSIIPVIIDFGKSHVIHNNVHHGFVNPYKFSTIQDILTLLVTSIHQIISEKRLEKNDFRKIMNLADFITNTGYRKDPFKTVKDMREFMHNAKKYANLISSDKHDLESKTCLDLLSYILKITPVSIKKTNTYIRSMNRGNAQQVFEYIFSETREERLKTYENVFIRLKHCTIPQPKCKLFKYYAAQTLENNIKSVWESFKKFLEREKMNTGYYERIYNSTITFLRNVYNLKNTEANRLTYKLPTLGEQKQAEYTEETFLIPNEIKNMLKPYEDYSKHSDILYIFLYKGEFELTSNDREFYINNLKEVLNLPVLLNIVNSKTLNILSEILYEPDIKIIREKISKESGDCTIAEKTLELYVDIMKNQKNILTGIKMFDSKFIFTLVGLIVAILAISKFNIGNTENFVPRSSRVMDIRITPAPAPAPSSCKGGCNAYYNPNRKERSTEDIVNTANNLANSVEESFFQEQNVPGPVPSNEVSVATYGPEYEETNLPVGDMTEGDPIIYDRLIFANKGNRLRGLGDPIRGDLPICPTNTGWFQVAADPQNSLQQGAMNVLVGASESGNAMNEFINSMSRSTDTTIGGTDVAGSINISQGVPFQDVNATGFL